MIKIFNIGLVYWRNTALSSLAIHTVWLRSAALSCTNIPALLIKSFYQELVLIGIAGILTIGAHIAAATQLALYEQDEEDGNGTQSE